MPSSALSPLCRPSDYAEPNGECVGQQELRLLHGRNNPVVTSFLTGQARQCARVWLTKALATPRFLAAVPARRSRDLSFARECSPCGGGLEAVVCRIQTEKPAGSQTRHYADHPQTSTAADQHLHFTVGIIRRSA